MPGATCVKCKQYEKKSLIEQSSQLAQTAQMGGTGHSSAAQQSITVIITYLNNHHGAGGKSGEGKGGKLHRGLGRKGVKGFSKGNL